ncbi:hypothetical protein GJU40_04490 [Bacillus lacus]|uniref:Fimbrial protein n=1 Tax=Metabacillus lacus TaxID=1983721 RepID=A0A7X2IX43_9BACI|nr:PilN domain-containing protein [Metabacillus lacus]MRX71431.1 hypothetical protein [Metabacillus lacus]
MALEINLLPEKKKKSYRTALLIAVFVPILSVLLIWLTFSYQGKKDELLRIQQETEQTAKQSELLQGIKAEQINSNAAAVLQNTVNWSISYPARVVPVLEEISSLLPETGYFQSLSYSGAQRADISVQFDNSREAAFYLNRLKSSHIILEAKLLSITTQQLQTEESGTEEEETERKEGIPRYIAAYQVVFNSEELKAAGMEGSE